jgi:hypothetical protein
MQAIAAGHGEEWMWLGPDVLQVGEREFRVGDQIVCGRNARMRLG